jgi:hypothetical protein
MRRSITVFIAVLLIAGLTACTGETSQSSESTDNERFVIGYSN